MDVDEAIRKRVASHYFTLRPVPDSLVLKLLRAGGMAPSPENYQPWEFVLIRGAATRRKLTDLKLESRREVLRGWMPDIADSDLEARLERNRRAMESAAVFVAVCYKDMDTPAEVGEMRTSPSLIAAWSCVSYIWLAATAEGLALSPTFYSHGVYPRAKAALGLPEGYELATVLRIGYPVKRPLGRKKTVLPLEAKIHYERF